VLNPFASVAWLTCTTPWQQGRGIWSEFIQNANDAGATECVLLLNLKSYGTSSLIGPTMKAWQGPALYFWNDAMFSSHDFQNLARLGQGSKLAKMATTGRFGLGFNACYHLTGPCMLCKQAPPNLFLVSVLLVLFPPSSTNLCSHPPRFLCSS